MVKPPFLNDEDICFTFADMKNNITAHIRFNRNEFSGAFGDIGTDLPLIIGMLLASDFNTANVLILFGIMQILTGLIYGMPMAVQPLKAVAMIVITQKISGSLVLTGGLIIGVIMLILSATRLLNLLGRIIPKTVIRGVQLGLGFQLAMTALKQYVPALETPGYILAAVSFIIALILLGNRKFPPALFIIALGVVYSLVFSFHQGMFQLKAPVFIIPEMKFENLWTAFALLALPQIPLSLGNSIYATQQVASDLFPEKKLDIQKIGFTYSIMNIISSLLGGIPVCHGSGGLAGQYTFGGRTGGAPIIYGFFYLIFGLFFSGNFFSFIEIFPQPVLGVILVFEGISLMLLVKDIITDKKNFFIAVMVAVMANGLPYGYFVAMLSGMLVYYLLNTVFLKHFGK